MNQTTKVGLIIGGALIVFVILPLVFDAVSGWSGYGYGGMMGPSMMGGFGGFGGMGIMAIVWILIIGLIAWAVVAAVRSGSQTTVTADSALEVLKKRYARGEISKQEYEDKKKDLL